MCGISGYIHFDPERCADAQLIDKMRLAATHRGPDDHGIYCKGPVGLGFNRLSIIDLAGGHQPMSNEDGTVWVVFNGEIYNFVPLHDELVRRGHRFRSRSDTETIVHAWEEYGESCVQKLRGMFSFVIWDERQQILFGARDRLGIKPFYWYRGEDFFAFASEMKSLLQIPEVPAEIDPAAVGEFLRRRYVIAPHTILSHVFKLPPAHTITVRGGQVSVLRYWDIPREERSTVSIAQAETELDSLLRECMQMHLVADVPLGAFLSGGLDSSCVVALMSLLGVADIKTFSIGYDSAESELDFARIVAHHFRTDHYEFRLTAPDFRDTLPLIAWHMDEPVGDTASIPLYYLSKFARQHVTVALSGEGSDELFGGYEIYRRMLLFEKLNHLPFAQSGGRVLARLAGDTKIRKYAEMLGSPLETRYGGVGALFSESQAQRLYPDGVPGLDGVGEAYRRAFGLKPLAKMSYVDITTWLADDLLVKADRMTMANSLELRVPLLDHVLVEFASRLPQSMKIHGADFKYILKRWARPHLPNTILERPKKGFPVPTRSWFRGDLAGFARESLLASNGIARTLLEAREIERVFEAHRFEDRSTQIYSLLVLDAWQRQLLAGRGDPRTAASVVV